ncbi:MAG TPA: hypothetical protein VM364_23010 [Vicinamibacterales bacterium]|nr:hypothetical protein [Vicinamibacterales bacterium]
MTAPTLYRICIWLPIVVPVTVILVYTAVDVDLGSGVVGEILAYSLLYGGIPYLPLALWATWWVGGRPEPEIRRMMLRAPLVMIVFFAAPVIVIGFALGAPRFFATMAAAGSLAILVLGYFYVGLTLLIRRALAGAVVGPPPAADR